MNRLRLASILLLLSLLPSCGGDDGAPPTDVEVVARAAGHELTVDQLVSLMSADSVPANPGTVTELANLWVDYTLMASAMVEDSTLSQLDLGSMVEERLSQERVARFRQEVVQLDTALTDTELRERYAAEATDTQVRARHILLAWPRQRNAASADSVRQLAQDLRDRIASGEAEFATVARERSDDARYASQGGDMGFLFPGEVIGPVEQAVFSLEPGALSEPFESNLGVHLVRVEERRTPPLGEYREWLQGRRVNEAAGAVIRELVAGVDARREDGAIEALRSLAIAPRRTVADGDPERPLLSWDGGAVTVEEARRFMLSRPVPFRMTAAQASEQELDRLVLGTLLQSDLLVAEAEGQGVTLPEGRADEVERDLRDALRELARRAGLANAEGQVEDAVMAALRRTVRGEQPVVPVGGFSYALSDAYDPEVDTAGLETALRRMDATR